MAGICPRDRSAYDGAVCISDDPEERLAELAEILVVGFLRLRARESARNSRDLREFPLDFAARPSVHGAPKPLAEEST